MFIIWRGWGIAVIPIAFVSLMLGGGIIAAAHLEHSPFAGLAMVGSAALGGLAIWALAHRIESEPGQVFIEKQTGREVEMKRSAGSLFFIPTRYWSFVVVGFGVLAAVGAVLSGGN